MTRSADSLDGLAFIDIETTGLDAEVEEIIEVGVCFVERGTVVARRSWLFQPSKPLPAVITALTGLTDDDLLGAPLLDRRRGELSAALKGWTLVAHNASFERSFLGPLVKDSAFVDSCEVMHLLFPELPSHSLDTLVRWAAIGESARHRALDDAEDTWQVLRTAFERFASSGRGQELERLVGRLCPPQSPDAQALVRVLAALATTCGGTARAAPQLPTPLVDESLVGRFVTLLKQHRAASVDVERPAAGAIFEAARRVGAQGEGPVTIAVPAAMLREVPAFATFVPRAQVCRTRLSELVESTADSDQARLTRGWLEMWATRSPHGDAAAHSGWMAQRLPETRVLLERARGCTCHDSECFVRRTERESDAATVLVVTHELALDWLERGAPMKLLVVDAEKLPETERRRTAVTLDARRLTSSARLLAPDDPLHRELEQAGRWLERSLPQDLRIEPDLRTSRVWLDVRDVLLGLQKDLAHSLARPGQWSTALRVLADDLSRLLGVVPHGFELRLQRTAVTLRVVDPAAALAERVRTQRVVLVASTRGGSGWARIDAPTPWVPPAVVPWSVETVDAPLTLEEAARLAARMSRDTVVSFFSELPLEELAVAFRAAPEARFRLVEAARALRGAGVLLGRWAGKAPTTSNVMLYDLDDWRAAVVACGARHLTLASRGGVADSVASELADVVAAAGVRRVVPSS